MDWTGFVKRGFVKYGLDWYVKHGLDWIFKTWIVKHGFVKHGFVKYEFLKTNNSSFYS